MQNPKLISCFLSRALKRGSRTLYGTNRAFLPLAHHLQSLSTASVCRYNRLDEGSKPGSAADRPAQSLSHRSCLVTGGTSGIGLQVSKKLILDGASVLISTRSAQKAQTAIKLIKEETGLSDAPIQFAEHDFKDDIDDAFTKWRTLINEKFDHNKFDTLINCAGISQSQALLSTSSEAISEILKINLEIPIKLSRHLLKEYFAFGKRLAKGPLSQIQAPKSFCIVNISSLLANRGGYGSSVYSTSKSGLTAFTRAITLEAASIRERFPILPPFRANVLSPGYIDTPMIENFSKAQREKLEYEIPLRRYGTAEEVADAVMFLLKNEYANNTILNLDGGLSAT